MLSDRPRIFAYLATAGMVACATLTKQGVEHVLHVNSYFAFYMLTVSVVAWAFGRGPGWFAVALSGALMILLFYPHPESLKPDAQHNWIQLGVMMCAAGGIVEVLRFAVSTRQLARRYSREAQRLSELASQTQTRMQHALGSLTEPLALLSAVRDPNTSRIVDFRIDYMNEVGNAMSMKRNGENESPVGKLLTQTSRNVRELGILDAYIHSVETGEPYSAEVSFVAVDGSETFWVDIHAAKLDDGIVVQWRDTTARHRSQETVRKNESRYRSLVQASSAIVWQANASGEFTEEQPQWAAFTGQSLPQYSAMGWLSAIHPEQREAFRKTWQGAMERRSLFEYSLRIRRYDGEYRDMLVRAVPMLDDAGITTEWIGTYTDITERVRAEEALRQSETRFRRLYESNQLGVVFYHADGRMTDPNDAFLNMLQISRADYLKHGINWHRITPPGWEEVDRINWEHLREKGSCGPFEKEYLRADGTPCPVLMSGANLDPGNPDHGVACVIDLSQIKKVESQLRDSQASLISLTETLERRVVERTAEAEQRSAQLRALALDLAETESRERKRLAKLLHDHFQQLISAAKLKAGLMRRGASEQKMVDALRQIEGLLEEAINASRSLATELSPPVLADGGLLPALDWIARKMERDYGMHVTLDSDPAAEPESDQIRTMLFECVRELLFNIVKHAESREASLTAKRSADGLLQIVVQDAGKGFDLDLAMQHSMATGSFGLFSIRERLSVIGGLLKIQSTKGQGTRVEMTVPVGVKKAANAEAGTHPLGIRFADPLTFHLKSAKPREPFDASHPARVVVADDHRLFREGLINLLSQEPMLKVVGEAADGEEAVQLCDKLRPDLLICDVTMPKLNGVQVAKQVSRDYPDTRVIGLSMHEREDMADAMRAAGASAYVTKSGAGDQLISIIRHVTSNQTREPFVKATDEQLAPSSE